MLLSHHSSFCCRSIESISQPFEPEADVTFRNAIKWYLYSWFYLKDLLLSDFFPDEKYPWIEEIMVPGGSLYHQDHWGDYPPGGGYYYSNVVYVLLGYLIERISNQSFEEYCMEHIITPLSMNNTGFYIKDLNPEKLAIPYMWLHRVYLPIPNYEERCVNPAGGLRTTIEDLSKYLIAHMNGGIYNGVRILNESTIEEMHTIQYPNIEPGNYGLGWEIRENNGRRWEGHSGSNLGFRSWMYFYSSGSSDKIGAIYFINEELHGSPIFGFFIQLKDYILHDILRNIFFKKILET
jgi:CubicO group peptidase (beta-lactamase class C family)